MMEVEEPAAKEQFKNYFRRDIRGPLDKIARDYVCLEHGSADFAFAYIPSEGVYYFLVNEEFQMLQDFTRRGVQVTSSLTLSHKVELIKAGVHSKNFHRKRKV